MRAEKRIVIFLPQANDSVSTFFDESFHNAYLALMKAANEDKFPFIVKDIVIYRAKTYPIHANRNECAFRLIEGIPTQGGSIYKPDISLWIDMDHVIPLNGLTGLLKHNRPIMLGVYYLKVKELGKPFYPVLFHKRSDKEGLYKSVMEFPEKKIFEVDMAGMGAACIHREVFEKLDPPFFKYREHPEGTASPDSVFKYEHKIEDISEDVHFWQQVQDKTNYPILVDPKVQFGHVGPMVYNHPMFLAYRENYKRQLIEAFGQEEFERGWSENAVAHPYQEIKIVKKTG